MAGTIVNNPVVQFFDNNGNPLAGGKITTYLSNTVTPAATYQDEALGVLNTNPIILNARGEATIWLTPDVQYTFVLTDADDTLIQTVNDIYGAFQAGSNVIDAAQVSYTPSGTGAVATTVENKLREWKSLLDFHDPADGSDYTNTLSKAIESGFPIYIPTGTYSVSNVTSVRGGSLTMFGSSPCTRSGGDSIIEFTDDGTGTGVGLNLDSLQIFKWHNLHFKCTGVVDGRSAPGDFVGVRSISASASRVWKLKDCFFTGFSTAAIDSESLIDCRFDNVSFNRCDNGLRARSGFFPVSGTTVLFINGYNTQNNYAHDIGSMSQSHWMDVVFENNLRGINASSGPGNTVQDCYGENNTEYTAFWSSVSSVLFIDNYSNGAGDLYVTQGSTGSFGFDAIGSTVVDRNGMATRVMQMYDRNGTLSERIKASNTSFSGITVIEDSAGTVQGVVPKLLASQNTGVADRQFRFMVKGIVAYGTPTGWTVTNIGTGIWQVTWPSPLTGNVRWPFISAQGIPNNSIAASGGRVDVLALIRARDASSLWINNQNMTVGFEVRIYTIDPTTGIMTAADEGAFIEVTY